MALLANDTQIQMAPIYQFLEVECESCVAPLTCFRTKITYHSHEDIIHYALACETHPI